MSARRLVSLELFHIHLLYLFIYLYCMIHCIFIFIFLLFSVLNVWKNKKNTFCYTVYVFLLFFYILLSIFLTFLFLFFFVLIVFFLIEISNKLRPSLMFLLFHLLYHLCLDQTFSRIFQFDEDSFSVSFSSLYLFLCSSECFDMPTYFLWHSWHHGRKTAS